MLKRVLYVTITNWGVGDELALRGTLSVMDDAIGHHLKFFADKNPEIRRRPDKPMCSDVWPPEAGDCDIDLVVHAGGNSWTGTSHAAWERYVVGHNIPVVYLGVGMFDSRRDEQRTQAVLGRCPLFIGRDDVSVAWARKLGARRALRLCCPSLFLNEVKPRGSKIGLVYQPHNEVGPHSCGQKELGEAQVALFLRVSKAYPTQIICHFIRDFTDAWQRFPNHRDRIRYSRSLDDYFGWYGECSKIMSMRLHGAYMGAALGLPTVCLKTSKAKCQALTLIGIPLIHPAKARADAKGVFSDPSEVNELAAEYRAVYRKEIQRALFDEEGQWRSISLPTRPRTSQAASPSTGRASRGR